MSCYECGDYPDIKIIDANGEPRQYCDECKEKVLAKAEEIGAGVTGGEPVE